MELPTILQEQLDKNILCMKLSGSKTPELDAVDDMIHKSQQQLAAVLKATREYSEVMAKSTKEIDDTVCFICGDGYLSKSEVEYYAEQFPGGIMKELNDGPLAGTEIYVTEDPLAKSHIKQYTRQDGTVVQEHDDKRVKKHPDLIAHENKHGDQIHSGSDLKHGADLMDHLKSRGWKMKEVSASNKKEGAKAGSVDNMPEPGSIKGKNQENPALQSAQRTIQKMHDAVKKGSDPVASLHAINTSRSNPYLAAVDDEKKKLLEHFGHQVDDSQKHTKFDKDGHTIIISKDGDKHKVEFAGGDIEAKQDGPVGTLAGKKEVESVDTGKKEAKFVVGRENKAYTAKLNPVHSKYALVEAHQLTTSHTIQGHVNKAYPQEIQPRERERLSSQMQMANIMNDVKPELFGHSATAADGAPIVGKDGAVESGNGRTIALTEAYNRGLADKYKEWLKSEADHFGLKPEDVEGMKHPMLVRLRDEDDPNKDRAEFAREANQSSNLGSSPAEQAWSDSERIDDNLLKKFTVDEDGEIYNEDNMDFINGFLDKLGKNESASLRDADGDPNKKAIERIQNAVFTKVYGSSMLTELQAESAKPKIRNVLKALNACVADFAQVRGHDDLDVVPDMMEAIEYTLAHQNESKAELEYKLRNSAALDFTGDTPTFKTDHATNMILAIADRSGSRNKLENVFRAISNEIKTEVASRENPEVDMFSGPYQAKNKEQVVKQALDKVKGEDVQKSLKSGLYLLKKSHIHTYLLRKSQMAFDFGAHDHHKAYDKVNASGTVSHIQAKGVQPEPDYNPNHKPMTRKEKGKPTPRPETEYRIARDDEPESGTKGRFLVYDKDMRIQELPNEGGEIEAHWPTLLEATRALNRHKRAEHSLSKVAKGEYDAAPALDPQKAIRKEVLGDETEEQAKRDGRGWFVNISNNSLHVIDTGSLGPHGDHDGWISIGENAEKVGVDKTSAMAFQAANYGQVYKPGDEHYAEAKSIADTDDMAMIDDNGEVYLPFAQGMPDERHEDLFRKQFGKDIYSASTTRFHNLARIRLWPGKNGGKSLLTVDIPEEGNQNATLRKLQEQVGKIMGVVGGNTIGSIATGNDDIGHIRTNLSDFLLARNMRELKVMQKSRSGLYLLRKSGHDVTNEPRNHGKWAKKGFTAEQIAKAEQFMPAPDGRDQFGYFHKEASDATGRPEGPIKLQIGIHHAKSKSGYGKVHIKANHWKKEIKPAGYASVQQFVSDVSTNFDAVYQVDKGRLALVKEDGNLAAIVEIERKDGESYYKVITAYVANKNKFKELTPLWRRSQSSQPATGEQEPSELGLAKSLEIPVSQRYPRSTDGQSGVYKKSIPNPKNDVQKSLAGGYLLKSAIFASSTPSLLQKAQIMAVESNIIPALDLVDSGFKGLTVKTADFSPSNIGFHNNLQTRNVLPERVKASAHNDKRASGLYLRKSAGLASRRAVGSFDVVPENIKQLQPSEYLRIRQRASVANLSAINHGSVAGDIVKTVDSARAVGNEHNINTLKSSYHIASTALTAVTNISDIGHETHNNLQTRNILPERVKASAQNDMRKAEVHGYITRTGRRVDGYCRNCGDGSIFDYKTDHHEDGTKHSYKECRNCGEKIKVTKRQTKQKTERAAKQAGFESLVNELLGKSGSRSAASLYILKKSIRREHGRTDRRGEVPSQEDHAGASADSSRRIGQEGRGEGEIVKSQEEGDKSYREGGLAKTGRQGFRAGAWLIKAHVAAYDRTTKSGALAHIAEHEDSRIRRYEIKLGRTKNSAELHKLRMERFAHLPHWGDLDDHTRQAVLDAEDEKHAEHKHFEEWHDKHVKKKPDAPGADKIDRSGWEQSRLFKARRFGLYLLRKSQLALFDPHHIAYTRVNKNGTVSQIKAKGAPRPENHQGMLDFNAEPSKPAGPTLVGGDDHTAFIANGKELFAHITGFDLKRYESEHKKLQAEVEQTRAAYWLHTKMAKEESGQDEHQPAVHRNPKVMAAEQAMDKARENFQSHSNAMGDHRKQIIDHFAKNTPPDYCKAKADGIGYALTTKQKKSVAEFYAIAGTQATSTLAHSKQLPKKGRANAHRIFKSISLTEADAHDTVWHECGHHIEFSHPEVQRAASKFRDARAKKDANGRPIIKTINELEKLKRYGDDERAVQDKFTSTYTGKVYFSGDTEIVSMGMGMLAKTSEFKKAVEKDPEFLHFTIGMLHHLHSK